MRVTLATGNPGKIRELKAILETEGLQWDLLPRPAMGEVAESGTTFEENAYIKAKAIHDVTGGFVLADDSGLEVDALGGAPGVHSARFAGPQASDAQNNRRLVASLEKICAPGFPARFVAQLCLLAPDGRRHTARGTCEGQIILAAKGDDGFGYDPYFRPDGFERSMAELSGGEKNKISHRGRALQNLIQTLKKSDAILKGFPESP